MRKPTKRRHDAGQLRSEIVSADGSVPEFGSLAWLKAGSTEDPATGCWSWTATKLNAAGYGKPRRPQ